MVLSLLAALCPSALALNPSLDINQYAHTAWTIRDGFFKSVIYTIAQTPDGYLWLGTGSGLLRFDGVRAVPWTPPGSRDLSDTAIRSLLAGVYKLSAPSVGGGVGVSNSLPTQPIER
jgi:ligand-binding sensor domain-containing protein